MRKKVGGKKIIVDVALILKKNKYEYWHELPVMERPNRGGIKNWFPKIFDDGHWRVRVREEKFFITLGLLNKAQ
ncbi:MAG: hypothetical protein CM15mP12_7670 [Gammaproteobacteria bacterium]|nr:MAG: hypothetical protein CM15mP12_7670 [Gammaproteobacteria bacterium]